MVFDADTIYYIIITILLVMILYMYYSVGAKKRKLKDEFEGLKSSLKSNQESILSDINKTHKEIMEKMSEEKAEYEQRYNRLLSRTHKQLQEYYTKKNTLDGEYKTKMKSLDYERAKLYSILNSTSPFRDLSEMYSDAKTLIFDEAEVYLDNYRRAWKSAEIVSDLKHKFRELMANFKELQYEHEYLLSMFPDLSKYIDGFSFEQTHDCDDYDHSRDWLSDEEYAQLSEDERNQRALDNWINGHKKTKLEIGYDYEMYIGHYYRTDKRFYWQVRQCGIEDGINDLGRDIIARRQDTKSNQIITHVIQCKNWSQDKQIHENVIAQLYGTAKMYEMEHSKDYVPLSLKVVPVLATTTEISDSAKRFADYLGVCVCVVPLGNYPRIKCNVNQTTNERIYHLPFDHQYYNVKIENTGEYYVSTVKEAVERGFRRAYKHHL